MGYKSYERYKDSGVEWIGEMPEGWEISKIKYNTYVKGRIGWQGLRADEFIDEGPYLVTGTDFINGQINWETCYHISDVRYNEAPEIHLQKGDLLITKDGTIGKVAIVTSKPERATLNSGIFLTRPLDQSYKTKYMYWLLNSSILSRYISYVKTGSTVSHLYQATYESFIYPLPKLYEQNAIANFLDQKTAEIDSLIADKKKMVQLLQEMRQAIISEAVTKGLDKNVKMKDSGVDWIGEIPEGWEVKKITWIFNLISSGTTPSSINYEYYDGSIFWVNTGDLNDGYIYNTSKKVTEIALKECSVLKLFPVNTLLIAMYGATIGKLGITKIVATTNQACCALVGDDNAIIKYVFYWFLANRDNIVSMAYGGGQPNISQNLIKSLRVPIPEIEEQITIANFLDQKTTEIDHLIADGEKTIAKLQEYRQSLISEAVTGKIDVRDFIGSTEGGMHDGCNAG